MDLIGYSCLFLMGIILGIMGAGGSILTIPILVYIFQIPALLATTYSLMIVGSSAFISVIKNKKEILFKDALLFTAPSVLSIFYVRSHVIPKLPSFIFDISLHKILMVLLVSLMLLASALMLLNITFQKNTSHNKPSTSIALKPKLQVIAFGLILGFLMGFLGTGGGFLIIPALIVFMGIDMKKAVPTSLFIIMINSWMGFLFDKTPLIASQWIHLVWYLTYALSGMSIGLYLRDFLPSQHLKRIFAVFIMIIAISIFIKEMFL